MAFTLVKENGKKITLLNPSETGKKFAKELKQNAKRTNAGSLKLKDKKRIELTAEERAFRCGYLRAQSDSAKCYNANKRKKTNKSR